MAKGLGDTTIADWFREGRDFYQEIAAKVYRKPVEQVTPAERQEGKVWYLMILYSAGPKKIAAETGMKYADAREFYQQFHDELPWIKALSNPPPSGGRAWGDYTPGMIERVLRQRKYLKTPWGRHLHPEQWGEFKMLNKLIQGSAADLMKLALVRVARALTDENLQLDSRIVLTVHDELVIDGPTNEIEVLHSLVPLHMIDPLINEVVPLGVEHEVSLTNLAEKEPYAEWHSRSKTAASASSSTAA